MKSVKELVRKNIITLKPYISARSETKGNLKMIYLDANENSYFERKKSRYPDPFQEPLREKLAQQFNSLKPSNFLLSNGSDEMIDLIFKTFCEPNHDKVLICSPTFVMYNVTANIYNVQTIDIPLLENYQLNVKKIIESEAKVLFLPCPNAPTGNIFENSSLEKIFAEFSGIVVIDEAYINFSGRPSMAEKLSRFPKLIVLQTFSKYWGLAGIRVGYAISSEEIIGYISKVKLPYNVNNLSADLALSALSNPQTFKSVGTTIAKERDQLSLNFQRLNFVKKIYPSKGNFIWVEVQDAVDFYHYLAKHGIIIRKYAHMTNFVRITIGNNSENMKLWNICEKYEMDRDTF